ncbi:hypothetical protein Tco_0043601 [Tanacetum coccineum]
MVVVEYFLDSQNFGSRKEDTVVIVVVVEDTPIVIDKLVRVTFAFQKEDTVARKNLSFVNLGEPGVVAGCVAKPRRNWRSPLVTILLTVSVL